MPFIIDINGVTQQTQHSFLQTIFECYYFVFFTMGILKRPIDVKNYRIFERSKSFWVQTIYCCEEKLYLGPMLENATLNLMDENETEMMPLTVRTPLCTS